jgi:trimeric autotransporter adhesin
MNLQRLTLAFAFAGPLLAQGIISTLAGNTWILPGGATRALNTPLGGVEGLAVDGKGNLFVADPDNHIVFKIAPDGTTSIVAGNGISGYSGDTGPAPKASLDQPVALAFDRAGNLYIADAEGQRVRKVAPDGTISTVAGNGSYGFAGDRGIAVNASMAYPSGVAVDSAGNLYISDYGNNRIRQVSPDGLINTYAGTGAPGTAGDGGPALNATFNQPHQIAIDSSGNLYVADDRRIRKITPPPALVSTIAGNGSYSPSGDGGQAVNAGLPTPYGVAVDAGGNVYVTDFIYNVVRVIDTTGTIRTIAGNLQAAYSGDGGPALSASLSGPRGVAVDASGAVYIADTLVNRIRSVRGGVISTIAGSGNFKFGGDGGPAALALLNQPTQVAVDPAGNIYIADQMNHRVRMIAPTGVISTIAGNGIRGFSGDGGPAAGASLNQPSNVSLDAQGNLYIADQSNHRIRRVTPAGVITTVAGGGTLVQVEGGQATTAALQYPFALTVAGDNLYICDTETFVVRKVSLSTGVMNTFAGNMDVQPTNLNVPATSTSIGYVFGIAADNAGNVYIAQPYIGFVRRITPAGTLVAFAGGGELLGEGVPATQAALVSPYGLAVDKAGNVYIADHNRVRMVNTAGIISTVAGNGIEGFLGDGGSALSAYLQFAQGVTVDSSRNVYIADSGNDRVRLVSNVQPSFQVAPANLTFAGTSGGPPTIGQEVQLTTTLSGLDFTVGGDHSWLQVSPAAGIMPAKLSVSADPGALSPGTYEATISITAPKSNPPLRQVSILFNVAAAASPLLAAEPSSVDFYYVQGTSAFGRSLQVLDNGSGTIPFQVSIPSADSWLSVTPLSGSASTAQPASLTVSANPNGLPPGTYTSTIAINSTIGQSKLVPVTMTIASGAQTMELSQSGLTFTGVSGVAAISPQNVAVLNTGLGEMQWTAQATTVPPGGSWLSIAPASGVSGPLAGDSPSIQVFANAAGLAPGSYSGQIQISAPGVANSPQFVSVVFNVLPAGSPPVPSVRPTGLIFVGAAGGSSPGSQEILVSNLGGGSLTFRSAATTSDGSQWFVYQPVQAAVAPDQPTRIVVAANTAGLSPGVRRGTLTLQFSDGSTSAIDLILVLPVSLTPPPTSTTQAELIPKAPAPAAACAPPVLRIVFVELGAQFNVSASLPSSLAVRVVDDCGNFLNGLNDQVEATFMGSTDPPVFLNPIGNGFWSGTWIANDPEPSVRITVTATTADHSLQGTAEITGGVTANPGVPVVSSDGIVNGASFAAHRPFAPGSFISIFGSSLADGPISSLLPFLIQLGNARVALGGIPLPLQFTKGSQINAVLPYNIPVNTVQQLVVEHASLLTIPIKLNVATAQPAIFTTTQSGSGQGAITVYRGVDQQPVADTSNPAGAGDTIIIYCTGLGAVTPAVPAGSMTPADHLTNTVNPASVTIGGLNAPVNFAGLTPGYAGLYQINAVVPKGVVPGDAVPVTATVAGQTSAPVTIAIR